MKSRHNITQDRLIVNATDDASDALFRACKLAQPVCTAADSPTANSGRGAVNARRSIRGRWCGMAVLIVFAAVMVVASITPAGAVSADICVNTTGWWRDGGAFNASGMPIQAAIDAADAGDTIIVRDGTYNENVDVNNAHLTIRSQNGSAKCIVDASSPYDHVFDVTVDYVNITGFTVTGATTFEKAGIYLGTDHCTISDNNALNNYYGICLSSSSNNTLTNNTANSNSNYGIYLWSSSNNTLTNNIASNNRYGIYLYYSSNNTLTSNTMSGNDYNFGVYGYSLSHYT